MPAEYLLRFDDVCPTMNWRVWDRVEEELRRNDIRPIVAVVPDNQDSKLRTATAAANFWDRARSWVSAGWTVAIHGYRHLYSTTDSGLVGLNSRSEFAGVPADQQGASLDAALRIFQAEHIAPTTWVAPGHSFDVNTLECLRARGIDVISDGFFSRPVRSYGCTWIPQQLWRLRRMPFGTWTACYHVNSWSDGESNAFTRDLRRFGTSITSVDRVLARRIPEKSVADACFSAAFRGLVLTRRSISRSG